MRRTRHSAEPSLRMSMSRSPYSITPLKGSPRRLRDSCRSSWLNCDAVYISSMHSIPTHIAHVRNRIADTARSVGRRAEDIRLVAVTKERTVDEIDAAVTAGLIDFGENYVQEALPKIAALSQRSITWHFIGAIQSNKTRDIATRFQWVHTIDRVKIARRLSDQRPENAKPLDVLVQVNVDDEPQKAGVSCAEAAALIAEIAPLPRLRVRGLM